MGRKEAIKEGEKLVEGAVYGTCAMTMGMWFRIEILDASSAAHHIWRYQQATLRRIPSEIKLLTNKTLRTEI